MKSFSLTISHYVNSVLTTFDITNLIKDGVTLSSKRTGSPASLKFSVVRNLILNAEGDYSGFAFEEGDRVILTIDGVQMFLGWVFTKKRSKDQIIEVTAYDQLRYLQNKHTYVYSGWTATQLIKAIAADFNLAVGTLRTQGTFCLTGQRTMLSFWTLYRMLFS
ncbi:MAG: hypothetical protein LIO87_10650 [Eubacterium sp.]|nr:hypothetical protein [Eubacterium sp.]